MINSLCFGFTWVRFCCPPLEPQAVSEGRSVSPELTYLAEAGTPCCLISLGPATDICQKSEPSSWFQGLQGDRQRPQISCVGPVTAR